MILYGDKTIVNEDRERAGAGSPPRRTSDGERKCRSGTKKHSYVTISDGP